MSGSFLLLAGLTIAGAIGAMNCGRLVYCALSLVGAFAGLAGLFLQLNAQFLGFVQVLVYVGAVAILIVFALLLTRNADSATQNDGSSSWMVGAGISGLVFAVMAGAILDSTAHDRQAASGVEVTIKDVGHELMSTYVIPLEALALLLTAAMIGAVVIAQRTGRPKGALK
jgi:NADH:ubiquinone oxidoreductase subunit 6 (subunit J)